MIQMRDSESGREGGYKRERKKGRKSESERERERERGGRERGSEIILKTETLLSTTKAEICRTMEALDSVGMILKNKNPRPCCLL